MDKIADSNESAAAAQVSVEKLLEVNSKLAQWVRNSGTAEEREAFNYLEALLDSYGLTTSMLEHPALISYPLAAKLTLFDKDSGESLAVDCLGTAFSASVDGLEAEIVDVGFGEADDYAGVDAAGKIALINGLATPTAVFTAEKAGTIGQIFINDDHLHYMIVSTVWGTPTPDSAPRLPTTPSVSIVEADGHDLRRRIQHGTVGVRLHSQVFKDWQQTPILVAELPGIQSDTFVLFSGHLDSWEVGAMDNGSANATMVEVARLLSEHRNELYRGLRLAFWSGHSHGRYSGSTWYADNYWEELHDRCVAHVNIDSTGARGATHYGSFPANLELGKFGEAVVQQHTGQQARARRMSRAGDMSFNGIGIPALFMSLSEVPMTENDTDYVSLAFGKLLGGKMPWWWHTSEDIMDKIDPDILLLDAQVYMSTLWRLCKHPLLPMDFRPIVADIDSTLTELERAVGRHLDLSLSRTRVTALAGRVARLADQCAVATAQDQDENISRLNAQIMALSRILIPITYTAAGRFDHDPAWSMPHLPALHEALELVRLGAGSDDYHFLKTQLVRNRNQVNMALRDALQILDS